MKSAQKTHTKNKFNLQYLKKQIALLYNAGKVEDSQIYYATYRRYGGTLSYKLITEGK